MKTILSTICLILVACAACAQTYDVHEWGTFTTLSGSDGGRLSGLVLEEDILPDFVYQHDRYHPTFRNKGMGMRTLQNVSVKMETPVIYFYSDTQRDVNVRVDFPNGCISQWYPERSSGESLVNKDTLDFSKPFNGWIGWDATVLAPDATAKYSADPTQASYTWTSPRATDANLVRTAAKNEVEKYLFYRGLGNFAMPLTTWFAGDGTMNVGNTGPEAIPYILVYHQRDSLVLNSDGKVERTVRLAAVWWSGKLDAGATVNINTDAVYVPLDSLGLEAKMKEFSAALERAGLYPKEAEAMLNTWGFSYFRRSGLKVFWIVPRSLTDQIIPIQITPAPNTLERVLVGRSEVLTPQFEQQLYTDMVVNHDTSDWYYDRYLHAYQERVNSMKASAGIRPVSSDSRDGITVYPNPAGTHCVIKRNSATVQSMDISLTNTFGTRVLHTKASSGTATLNLADLPAGAYMLQVTEGTHIWVSRLVKK